jgi:Fe-S oxidoreductase
VKRSKRFVSEVLSTLKDNIQRTGDPLGMRGVYWTDWAKDLHLRREGDTLLLTSRMYQMLPYIMQVTSLVASSKPFLSRYGFGPLVGLGNRLMGDYIIRLKALAAGSIKSKSKNALRGIVNALSAVGESPAYLYEDEPYSGVLLYDLGLDEFIDGHVKAVNGLLKKHGVRRIIGVDPHTVFMMREIYPKYIEGFDIEVKHYLEILSEESETLKKSVTEPLERNLVIHDSCYLTRELGVIEQVRAVLSSLGVAVGEPENTRLDTACCGGPIEYAYQDLTEKISRTRAKELSAISEDVVVVCPICLINLSKYERELGIKVWDFGELLLEALGEPMTKHT